jgi:hypothetical protein
MKRRKPLYRERKTRVFYPGSKLNSELLTSGHSY